MTTEIKERPILFSGEMVRAILDRRKTQTRRVVKSPDPTCFDPRPVRRDYEVGMRLWVRETWQEFCPTWDGQWCGHGTREGIEKEHRVVYRATNEKGDLSFRSRLTKDDDGADKLIHTVVRNWRPSIFLPRWASRITLEITEVRVERLQEITETDAISEGVFTPNHPDFHVGGFHALWDSINGKKHPWESNPWVWVVSFKQFQATERQKERVEGE